MGLDQYLNIIKADGASCKKATLFDPRSACSEEVLVIITTPEGGVRQEVRPAGKPTNTWRNWNALHAYMMKKRRNQDDRFVLLGFGELDDLEKWFRKRDPNYDSTEASDDSDASEVEYYRQLNKRILTIARAAIAKGCIVEYTSWD